MPLLNSFLLCFVIYVVIIFGGIVATRPLVLLSMMVLLFPLYVSYMLLMILLSLPMSL